MICCGLEDQLRLLALICFSMLMLSFGLTHYKSTTGTQAFSQQRKCGGFLSYSRIFKGVCEISPANSHSRTQISEKKDISSELLASFEPEEEAFLSRTITGDET